MTVTIDFSANEQAALEAQARAEGLSVEGWIKKLARERASLPREPTPQDDRPIWEVILNNTKNVPPKAFDALPADGASQVDHYLYGHPKRG